MTIARPGTYLRGQPGFVVPGSAEHAQLITPSKVAAILGEARWETPFSLWHRMKGTVPPQEPKTEFDIGHDMEPYMANRWRRRHPGWRLSSTEVQIVVDNDKSALGFPAAVTLDRRGTRGRARRVVEFKCARDISDLEKWGDDLSGDCPVDYWVQVQAQMLFSGWTAYPAHLLAVGPYWNERVYEIEPDRNVFKLIAAECQRFWESLACDEPPPLDDSPVTYETVRQLHPDIDGTTVEVDARLGFNTLDWHHEVANDEKRLREHKARLLDAMGNAQTATCGGVKVADRTPHARGGVALRLATKNYDALKDLAHPEWS
jgi:predicted phage-related endonuclease